jgi:integrase
MDNCLINITDSPMNTKGSGHADGKHGQGRLFRRGRIWWCQYYLHGQQVRESSKSDLKAVAQKLLMRRLVAADEGTLPAKRRPVTYEEMRERLVNHRLKANPRLSKVLSEGGLTRLDKFFAGMQSSVITEDKISEFVRSRQATGASNATINRSLEALKIMFRLSAKLIKDPPHVEMLKEPPARKGFLKREQYLRLLATLPEHVRPIFTFGYCTGMRLGELRNLTWRHVDLKDGVIRLESEDTKNEEPRVIPYRQLPELAEIVDRLWRKAADKTGHVFTHADGSRLITFRKSWSRACIKSMLGKMVWECPVCHQSTEPSEQSWPPEVPRTEPPHCPCGNVCRWKYRGLIFHDLRRTAIRNLRRSGVAESVAMKISGHKTREVFERYNIVDAADTEQAMEKLAQFNSTEDQKLKSPGLRPN